jgi:xylose isomerase
MNRGDPRNGWDTDQFPNNAQELVPAMLQLVTAGGFRTGGFTFDAKLRRQSVHPHDLYLAHIGGMDTLARALLAAVAIIDRGRWNALRIARYAGWDGPFGQRIEGGAYTLATLADEAHRMQLMPQPRSGQQELFESIIANQV